MTMTQTLDVLVVDDDPHIRNFLVTALTQVNYRCAEASNGRIAASMLQKDIFRLIVTDIYMPTMDGLEFITFVNRLDPRPIVIAISGGGRFSKSSSALEPAAYLGCTRILAKPFDETDIILVVWELIGMGSLNSLHTEEPTAEL